MSLVNEVGLVPMIYDPVVSLQGPPTFSASLLLDASTEKAAFVGVVWHPTVKTGTISIRKVHFRLGAVTFNAASVFRVSLQNISLTAGPPYQPDGTQDQTGDLTSLTANGMNVTGNLSADRAVNLSNDSVGDADSRWLCVVFEYQTFTAGDSIIVSTISTPVRAFQGLGGEGLLNTAGTWVIQALCPILVLECADGTFAFLRHSVPFSTLDFVSVFSTGAIQRAGLKFKFPTQRKISAASLKMLVPNNSDGRLVLYDSDGSTELVSVDVDNDAVLTTLALQFEIEFAPVTLAADTFYRFVFVAGTITAAQIYYGAMGAVGHMDGLILGQNAHWTQYDGTSWTDTTTRRPFFGLGVSAVHNGVNPILQAGM